MIRNHGDLELLVSYWSIKTHTSITSSAEFTNTIGCLCHSPCIVVWRLKYDGSHSRRRKERTLLYLKNIEQVDLHLMDSYFNEGKGLKIGITIEAMLSY